MEHIVTKEHIEAYCAALQAAERAGLIGTADGVAPMLSK